jgi:hypothetical protein
VVNLSDWDFTDVGGLLGQRLEGGVALDDQLRIDLNLLRRACLVAVDHEVVVLLLEQRGGGPSGPIDTDL